MKRIELPVLSSVRISMEKKKETSFHHASTESHLLFDKLIDSSLKTFLRSKMASGSVSNRFELRSKLSLTVPEKVSDLTSPIELWLRSTSWSWVEFWKASSLTMSMSL